MPRMENDGAPVWAWGEANNLVGRHGGEGSSTWDLCRDCAETYEGAGFLPKGCEPYQQGEPAGELMEIDSPLFDDDDLDGYVCAVCNCALNSDNY